MFTLLTGPGYDADGDLSWGAHWDDWIDWNECYYQGIATDMRPEWGGQVRRYHVQAFFHEYTTNERKSA